MTDDSTEGGSTLFIASSLAAASLCEGAKTSPSWGEATSGHQALGLIPGYRLKRGEP